MTEHQPKRYFQHYGDHDCVTDSVRGSDGREHIVTMRGWHWYNLDWIKECTNTPESMLVDNAVIGLYEVHGLSVSEAMEASIYYFIEAYDTARKERLARESTEWKDVAGRS